MKLNPMRINKHLSIHYYIYIIKKMRPNCLYENCLCRQGKNGFCVKHREIGEAVEALLLLKKITNLSCNKTK